MEGYENNWDEFLHDPLQYTVDTLGHPEGISALHAYDFELSSGFWGPQTVRIHSPDNADFSLAPQ
jgi:hypothetical protein